MAGGRNRRHLAAGDAGDGRIAWVDDLRAEVMPKPPPPHARTTQQLAADVGLGGEPYWTVLYHVRKIAAAKGLQSTRYGRHTYYWPATKGAA